MPQRKLIKYRSKQKSVKRSKKRSVKRSTVKRSKKRSVKRSTVKRSTVKRSKRRSVKRSTVKRSKRRSVRSRKRSRPSYKKFRSRSKSRRKAVSYSKARLRKSLQKLRKMTGGEEKKIPKRISNRPAKIKIPKVRVINNRLQEIEVLKAPSRRLKDLW